LPPGLACVRARVPASERRAIIVSVVVQQASRTPGHGL